MLNFEYTCKDEDMNFKCAKGDVCAVHRYRAAQMKLSKSPSCHFRLFMSHISLLNPFFAVLGISMLCTSSENCKKKNQK